MHMFEKKMWTHVHDALGFAVKPLLSWQKLVTNLQLIES
jgi:hypothetical protein